jgi:glycosyltransferase involved in cell wall biosynthesis
MLRAFLYRLERSRFDPDVVFLKPGAFEREIAALGLRTHVIESARLRNLRHTVRTIRQLAMLLRELRPDVVVSWAAKPHLYTAPAALLAHRRARLVWWQHGIPDGHWVDRLATCLPATAIGCSSQAAAAAQTRLRPRRRLFVVHPGIEGLAEEPRPRAVVRRALGLPEHAFLAGVVGRLQPDKGQDVFLHALARVRSRGHQIHGVIVGGTAFGLSAPYAVALERLVTELGLESSVTLTGHVSNVETYLRAVDVFVNPSTSESFGVAIIEAMSAGLAVVNAARGGPEEIIEPGVTGITLPSREPAAIADAIETLIVDDGLRRRLARMGQAQAANFTADAMSQRLENALAQLAR